MAQDYERRTKQASDVIEGYLTALFDFLVSGYYLDLKKEKYYAIGQVKEYYEKYNAEEQSRFRMERRGQLSALSAMLQTVIL